MEFSIYEAEELPIGDTIRHLRTARKWSQKRLAEAAGVEQSLINYAENRPVSLRVKTLAKIAAALELKLSEFVEKAEKMQAETSASASAS